MGGGGKFKRTGRAVSPVNFLEREGGEVNTSAGSKGGRVFPLGTKQFVMTASVIGSYSIAWKSLQKQERVGGKNKQVNCSSAASNGKRICLLISSRYHYTRVGGEVT